MTSEVLIVDPEKQGELVLVGTGHHFDKVDHVPVCYTKTKKGLGYTLNVIGYGMDFYTDGVWEEVRWYYLPDNLGERIMNMKSDDFEEIQKRLYKLLPPLRDHCFYCAEKCQPGRHYCAKHLREEQIKQAGQLAARKAKEDEWKAGAPRRKRIRRRVYGGLLAVVLYFAACDFGTLTPRQWVKNAAYTVGNTLKSIERK
jgi:hypothetical protein